jgi:hypothetical protein
MGSIRHLDHPTALPAVTGNIWIRKHGVVFLALQELNQHHTRQTIVLSVRKARIPHQESPNVMNAAVVITHTLVLQRARRAQQECIARTEKHQLHA